MLNPRDGAMYEKYRAIMAAQELGPAATLNTVQAVLNNKRAFGSKVAAGHAEHQLRVAMVDAMAAKQADEASRLERRALVIEEEGHEARRKAISLNELAECAVDGHLWTVRADASALDDGRLKTVIGQF